MNSLLEQVKEVLKLFIFLATLLGLITLMCLSASAQTREQIEATIVDAAMIYDIDPHLAIAIAEVESGLNPRAVGGLGERGVFQLRPEYHRYVNGDTRQNIYTAVAYLAEVKRLCEPKYGKAWLIAFNLGPNYSKRIRYPSLFPYYLKVRAAMDTRLASN